MSRRTIKKVDVYSIVTHCTVIWVLARQNITVEISMPHPLFPGTMRKLLPPMLLFTGDGRECWNSFWPVKTDVVSSFIQNHNVSESHFNFSVIPYSNIMNGKWKNEKEKMTFSSIALSPYWINSKWPILIYFISFLFILWFRFFPKILKNRIEGKGI